MDLGTCLGLIVGCFLLLTTVVIPICDWFDDGGFNRIIDRCNRIIFRDKHGWPVEKIKGKPVTNVIRTILHTNLKQTFRRRKL